MAKKQISPFLAPSKSLVITGTHAYAYSGTVTITSGSYTAGLDFRTGNYYSLLDLQVQTADVSGADLFYQVTLNGTVILQQANNNPAGSGAAGMETPIKLVIPPHTEVIVSGLRGSGSDYDIYLNLTGRIYA